MAKSNNRLVPQIRTAREMNDDVRVRFLLHKKRPEDIAELCRNLHAEEIKHVLGLLEPEAIGAVMADLDPVIHGEVIEMMDPQVVADALDTIPSDEAADILENIPEELAEATIERMESEAAEDVEQLMTYPPDTAGGIMTPDVYNLEGHITVAEAIRALREDKTLEQVSYLYVTDRNRRLIGVMPLKRLIAARDDQALSEIMTRGVISARVDDDQEKVAHLVQKYDFRTLPIVDLNGTLVGRVTADDVMDVIEEEATEDMLKIGSVMPFETSVLKTRFTALYARRVVWLILLVFVNIFSGAGIAYHEHLIESVVALVFFLPLLIASGGNSGAQASTLIVRSMATGDVNAGDYARLLLREVGVSLALGATMAVCVYMIAWYRAGPEVALVVFISMITIVVIGSLIGISLPFLLKKFNMDPATASAPLVTSIADIAGVLIYLGIATALLDIMDPAAVIEEARAVCVPWIFI